MGVKKMKVVITKEGRTEIRVEGGQGEDCLAFTKNMEQALGQVQQREFNEDYHAPDSVYTKATDSVTSRNTRR